MPLHSAQFLGRKKKTVVEQPGWHGVRISRITASLVRSSEALLRRSLQRCPASREARRTLSPPRGPAWLHALALGSSPSRPGLTKSRAAQFVAAGERSCGNSWPHSNYGSFVAMEFLWPAGSLNVLIIFQCPFRECSVRHKGLWILLHGLLLTTDVSQSRHCCFTRERAKEGTAFTAEIREGSRRRA